MRHLAGETQELNKLENLECGAWGRSTHDTNVDVFVKVLIVLLYLQVMDKVEHSLTIL